MSTPSESPMNPEQIGREISQLTRMREQIQADMEAMRTQESNLRAFETRIRGSMPPMGVGSRASFDSKSPVNLDAEWEKFQRSRALLEAERRALTDERLVIREEREILRQREEALRQRESWVEVRERELAAKAFPPPEPPAPAKPTSQTPFEIAKNMLSFRRAS